MKTSQGLLRYQEAVTATRPRRMKWWHEARFGMFVHWGLYSIWGRGEWVMNRERTPLAEYEALTNVFRPKRGMAREWARLAVRTGMKYMVLTTKHHDGFCLWDTQQHDYHAVKRGPGRDLVREYVDACREYGLKVGLYYSLMDWRHPDGDRCAHDAAARRRFLDFTQGCVRELCTNYGKIDILWYDMAFPMKGARAWESLKMNQMVRALQPGIILNNRCHLEEDYVTPEVHIGPAERGRAWESCMVLNGVFGWQPTPIDDWVCPREILLWLRQATARQGNILLNIAPKGDGSVPSEYLERLGVVGRWLKQNGEAVYGNVDYNTLNGILPGSDWTLRGNTGYYWVQRWNGRVLHIGAVKTQVKRVTILASGREVRFQQDPNRLTLLDLPARCPDRLAQSVVLKMEFAGKPQQECRESIAPPYQRAPQA